MRRKHVRLRERLTYNRVGRRSRMWDWMHTIQEPWATLLHNSRKKFGRLMYSPADRTDRNLTPLRKRRYY